jgi:hypothetical protein
MKKIRLITIVALAIFAGLFIISCGSAEEKLVGSWVTESVTANVDSTKANLAVIDQTIASTKTTRFLLNEDHTMALSIDGYTTDAFWTYNPDNDRVSFRLEAEALNDAIELGKFDGDKIFYTSSVKHGTITAVYVKE